VSLANAALVIDFDTSLFGTPGAPAPAPGSAGAAAAPPTGAAVSTANGVHLAGIVNGAVRCLAVRGGAAAGCAAAWRAALSGTGCGVLELCCCIQRGQAEQQLECQPLN